MKFQNEKKRSSISNLRHNGSPLLILVFMTKQKEEVNDLFNDALNTFYLWLYSPGHNYGNEPVVMSMFTIIIFYFEGRKEMVYLMMHSTHFYLRL